MLVHRCVWEYSCWTMNKCLLLCMPRISDCINKLLLGHGLKLSFLGADSISGANYCVDMNNDIDCKCKQFNKIKPQMCIITLGLCSWYFRFCLVVLLLIVVMVKKKRKFFLGAHLLISESCYKGFELRAFEDREVRFLAGFLTVFLHSWAGSSNWLLNLCGINKTRKWTR